MRNTTNTPAAPAEKQIKKANFFTKRRDYNIWGVFVLALGAIIMLFPFVFALSGSLLKNGNDIYRLVFFKDWEWSNYARVLREFDFVRYAINTLSWTAVSIVAVVLSNSFIGFGFARYEFRGSSQLFFGAICTMFLPSTVMTIPQFIIWSELGMVDTYIPLTFGYFFGSAHQIFLMRQCFKGMPAALYEAALIDGAHPLYIWARIYMPLARPMMATMALSTFQSCWNALFGPLIYLTSIEKRTVALALANFNTKYANAGDPQIVMAAAILAMAPTILLYGFLQRQFISGMASAAVKG